MTPQDNESRKVPAAHGWMWVKHGFWLFKKAPLLWMVLTAIGVVGLFGISMIPIVGDPLSTLLFPALLAGYMFGCHALARGEELELAHLFSGFYHNAQRLVALGGINLVAQLLILGLMMATGGSAVVNAMMDDKTASEDPSVLIASFQGAGYAITLGAALFAVLMMAMQFAPMLVIFRNMAPFPAMRASLRAFLRNMLPFTVYSLMLVPFAIVASLPMMLGWLALLPVVIASLYATYRDLFPMEGDVEEHAAPEAAPAQEAPPSEPPQP
jgi:uncharacterized membrane protein